MVVQIRFGYKKIPEEDSTDILFTSSFCVRDVISDVALISLTTQVRIWKSQNLSKQKFKQKRQKVRFLKK